MFLYYIDNIRNSWNIPCVLNVLIDGPWCASYVSQLLNHSNLAKCLSCDQWYGLTNFPTTKQCCHKWPQAFEIIIAAIAFKLWCCFLFNYRFTHDNRIDCHTNNINNYWTNNHNTWGNNYHINIHYSFIKQQLEDYNQSWWSRQKSDFACDKGWGESISSYRWVRSTLRWTSHASHTDVNTMCKVGFGNYCEFGQKKLALLYSK